MQPVRYRPPAEVIQILLIISGYLRELPGNYFALAPHIKGVTVSNFVQNQVKAGLDEITTTAGKDDDLRLSLRLSKAQEMVDLLRQGAKENPAFAEIFNESREYDFREFFPGGKKHVTLDQLIDELRKPDLGSTPCMNLLSGQVQDYVAWLNTLPPRPR